MTLAVIIYLSYPSIYGPWKIFYSHRNDPEYIGAFNYRLAQLSKSNIRMNTLALKTYEILFGCISKIINKTIQAPFQFKLRILID